VLRTILTSLVLILAATAAQAQSTPSAKILVVDFNRVSRESLVGQDISDQMESNRTKLEQYARQVQQQLGTQQQELQQQRNVISQEAFQQRLQQFQQKAQQRQSEVQQLTKQARQAMQQANSEIRRALRPIVRDIMEERGANLVLDKAVVSQNLSGLDVTTEVIERLNQKMDSHQVDLPQVPSASGSSSSSSDGGSGSSGG